MKVRLVFLLWFLVKIAMSQSPESGPWPTFTGDAQEPSGTSSAAKQLTISHLRQLIRLGTPDATIAQEIGRRGISFRPSAQVLSDLRKLGAGQKTIAALSSYTAQSTPKCASAETGAYWGPYAEEYAFFKTAFDQSNGTDAYAAERDVAFSIIVQRVDALKRAGAKISLGGMLSLLIYEGGARLAHYNTLCQENDYDKSDNCWEHPEARYSYQLGLGAVHTSNFHPCKDRLWTGAQRKRFAQLATPAGFSPTAEQIAAVAAELHTFCPVDTEPEAVDYYILRANDLGIPKNTKGNALALASKYALAQAGKYPFFCAACVFRILFLKS